MKRAFTTLAAVLTIAVLAAACAGQNEGRALAGARRLRLTVV